MDQIKKGGGEFPSLENANKKFGEAAFKTLITTGRRRMPAFTQMDENEQSALASYVLEIPSKQKQKIYTTKKSKQSLSFCSL